MDGQNAKTEARLQKMKTKLEHSKKKTTDVLEEKDQQLLQQSKTITSLKERETKDAQDRAQK